MQDAHEGKALKLPGAAVTSAMAANAGPAGAVSAGSCSVAVPTAAVAVQTSNDAEVLDTLQLEPC